MKKPSVCPFCGADNMCGIAVGKTSCWCFDVTVPAQLLLLLPGNKDEQGCICRSCIELYQKTPELFLSTYIKE